MVTLIKNPVLEGLSEGNLGIQGNLGLLEFSTIEAIADWTYDRACDHI